MQMTQLETREFYGSTIDEAVMKCAASNHDALFMPELIDRRLSVPSTDRLWQNWLTSSSIRATGKTRQGSKLVVYAHVPSYFSSPMYNGEDNRNERGAGKIPQDEFERLVKMAENGENGVYLVPHEKVRTTSLLSSIPIEEALAHPQIIPFCGGEERAKAYLKRLSELKLYDDYRATNVGVSYTDDLHINVVNEGTKEIPKNVEYVDHHARFLSTGYYNLIVFNGHHDLVSDATIVGKPN